MPGRANPVLAALAASLAAAVAIAAMHAARHVRRAPDGGLPLAPKIALRASELRHAGGRP